MNPHFEKIREEISSAADAAEWVKRRARVERAREVCEDLTGRLTGERFQLFSSAAHRNERLAETLAVQIEARRKARLEEERRKARLDRRALRAARAAARVVARAARVALEVALEVGLAASSAIVRVARQFAA